MPESKRRAGLSAQATGLFYDDFARRVLSFDAGAAAAYAVIAARRQLSGNRIGPIDGMIAAIARAHGAPLATRDRDFSGCEITIINPWLET